MPDLDTGERGTGTVYCVSLNVDANHDGTMDLTFNGPDVTSQSSPFVFWANNNFDRWATTYVGIYTDTEQDDQEIGFCPATPGIPTADCNYLDENDQRVIPCTRDLEDYARLWLSGISTNLLAALPTGSTVSLSWGDVGSPNPANPTIDLFQAADANGGIGYLTNETIAAEQTNISQCKFVGRLAPGGSIQLNAPYFPVLWAGNHFIWCGVNNGTGALTLTIADGNSNTLAQATVYMQIKDIKQMYERWTVGDQWDVAPTTTVVPATDGLPSGVAAFRYPVLQNTNTSYILHVHGYNMEAWVKDRFAETEYKRLYWQGYQGRFGEFRWPTTQQGIFNLTSAFDRSESNAWASATGLLNLLTNLNAVYPGNVYLTAHSHGNVVAGEALLKAGNNQVVNTYIAMQAAVPAHSYDSTTPYRYPPDFPDFYAHYWTASSPCYFNGSAGAGTYVNFFNTNDWALTTLWEPDQNLKPDNGYHYISIGNQTNFYSGSNPYYTILLPPADRYSIFAYCDPATCMALGAQAGVDGVFNKRQVDLPSVWPPDTYSNSTNYNAHVWHSAEFRSDNPSQDIFWQTVLGRNGFNLK
jgi:hypothetical protein